MFISFAIISFKLFQDLTGRLNKSNLDRGTFISDDIQDKND